MPYGVARTSAAEAMTRRIETDGPLGLLPEALLDLIEAYTFNNDGAKSFVVFARVLRLWDESPDLFDAGDEFNLFWEFKWVAADLPDYPQITHEQARAFLDDMTRRFELAGHGISSVRMCRFLWAWHTGNGDAERDRLAWTTGLRDDLEDCPACTIGQQVGFFTESGRHEEAVRLALTQRDSCNLEPARTRYALALSALLSGDPDAAAQAHARAIASDDGQSRDIGSSRGQAFEMLARGGQLPRALRTLRNDYAELLHHGSTPLARLRFLFGVLAGLTANLSGPEAQLDTGFREEQLRTVSSLQAWVRTEAEALVTVYDTRNGNDYYARQLDRALQATLVSPGLPASMLVGQLTQPEHSPASVAPREAQAAAEAHGDDIFDRAEVLAASHRYGDAARAYVEAAGALEQEGWIERSGLARAEAAQCAVLDSDDEAAHALFASALPLLRSGGADLVTVAAVLTAWAPTAARMDDPLPQIHATVGALDAVQARLTDTSAERSEALVERDLAESKRLRAQLSDTLARAIASADPVQLPDRFNRITAITTSRAAAEEFAELGLYADAAHAFWLSGRVQRELGDVNGAIWSYESAFEGFSAAHAPSERAEVAGELIELLRGSGMSEHADKIVNEL